MKPWRRLSLPLLLVAVAAAAAPGLWQRLENDGVHDPRNPGIGQLQQPAEALAPLSMAATQLTWLPAVSRGSGAINPRTSLFPETVVRLREDEIVIAKFGSMPAVRFPHRQHTLWLDCANCHDGLFKAQAGANRFSMTAILNGEQCGVCHGAVAFPLTECNRCHNTPNASLRRRALP
jgi:c(7)-type cytochrome triheme protein